MNIFSDRPEIDENGNRSYSSYPPMSYISSDYRGRSTKTLQASPLSTTSSGLMTPSHGKYKRQYNTSVG